MTIVFSDLATSTDPPTTNSSKSLESTEAAPTQQQSLQKEASGTSKFNFI